MTKPRTRKLWLEKLEKKMNDEIGQDEGGWEYYKELVVVVKEELQGEANSKRKLSEEESQNDRLRRLLRKKANDVVGQDEEGWKLYHAFLKALVELDILEPCPTDEPSSEEEQEDEDDEDEDDEEQEEEEEEVESPRKKKRRH